MCGIAGYILKQPQNLNEEILEKLLFPIRKRGPDDEGIHLINRFNTTNYPYSTVKSSPELPRYLPLITKKNAIMHDVAFIHTRYSIIDLSEKAHQPFISADQNIIAIFHGEIYNYLELKEKLQQAGVVFRTRSDTEVMVEGYRIWGHEFWNKANGFWAIALYDKRTNEILLCRDRIGVAPLYYRNTPQGLYFSSYLESLIDISPNDLDLNDDTIIGFIQTGIKDHNCSTFYSQIHSIPPASMVVIRPNEHQLQPSQIQHYWYLPQNRWKEKDIDTDRAVKIFQELLFNAVEIRMRSDVPIAFELSGGLDSSSIVAAAALISKKKIKTFTAKISDANEEPLARKMTKKYDLDFNVIQGIENQFSYDYPMFNQLMEEPFDNPNAYTHYQMLNQMKHQHTDVVITGAGGDEVFAGYESSFWSAAYRELNNGNSKQRFHADWHEFCRRYRNIKNTTATFKNYLNILLNPLNIKNKTDKEFQLSNDTKAKQLSLEYPKLNFHQRTLYHFQTALLPFYMRSSDHFTMGIPIEHRFPLLDYRIIEFGLRLPITYLFKNGWTKYIIRKSMEKYLPKEITWRRDKMGFKFPYKNYFLKYRNVFKPLLEDITRLDPSLKYWNNYEKLLQYDPVLLWRVLSVIIWYRYTVTQKIR
ncbi:MAG: asparagine synthase (glutamine-hydrolyzing) [Candidatus Omnitrophica bacterium]|nr:asparagine synthase (glutamine-hydrolyzing) [Candidatus Omnitrophota bacterium]